MSEARVILYILLVSAFICGVLGWMHPVPAFLIVVFAAWCLGILDKEATRLRRRSHRKNLD